MKKFNNSDLFTGYLKQLLHNFNLPKIKVYTKEHWKYKNKNNNNEESPEIFQTLKSTVSVVPNQNVITKNVRYFPYIRNGEIQEYINNNWVNIGATNNKIPHNYVYGEKILNYTKNLKIDSNVYDSYTHEYLGDYLRFHRDFMGLNLMPLYNCFSNRSCDKLAQSWRLDNGTTISFNTSDTNFKIYMIPVKLFKSYTIAIDSAYPIEMCCGIYGDYQDTRNKFAMIPRLTYKKVSNSIFSQPFLYDLLAYTEDNQDNTLLEILDDNERIELAQNEMDLKLFLKVPVENNSTIVILEGDYLNWNNSYYAKEKPKTFQISGYLTALPTNLTTADLDKIYLINDERTDSINLYKVVSNSSNSEITLSNLGSIWGSTIKYSKNSNQFRLIKDDTTEAETIEDAFRTYMTGKIISKPFIAYYNSNLNQLYVPSRGFHKTTNKTVINLENKALRQLDSYEFPLITPLQLLHCNTREQHPFADRLIEYLTGNAITNSEDEIYDNVKRAQKAILANYSTINCNIGLPGLWNNEMRVLFYEYMTTNKLTNRFDINHDILGYVDKDVEKYYAAAMYDRKAGIKYTISLSNLEIEEENN